MPIEHWKRPMRIAGEDLRALKDQIERGQYRVDPPAVAEAILRRLRSIATGSAEHVEPPDRDRTR